MSINQSILQGQGVGTQIGGVSASDYERVQESIARQQQANGGGGGGGGGGGFGSSQITPSQDWESLAWLILGLL